MNEKFEKPESTLEIMDMIGDFKAKIFVEGQWKNSCWRLWNGKHFKYRQNYCRFKKTWNSFRNFIINVE